MTSSWAMSTPTSSRPARAAASTSVKPAQALASGPQFVSIQEDDGSAVPADAQARIEDALAYWSSVLASQGVTFTEIPAGSAAADFPIHLSPTSVLGGVADGVLGVTTAD